MGAVLLALMAQEPMDAQPRCRKGIPCGMTCISATKTCRIGTSTVDPPPTANPKTRSEASRATALSKSVAPVFAFVGSKVTRTYLRGTCPAVRQIDLLDQIMFDSEYDARSKGYTRAPDSLCAGPRPPSTPETSRLEAELDSVKELLALEREARGKDWAAAADGRFYYRASCRAALELPKRVYFATEDEAQATGRRRSAVIGC